MLQSPTSRRTRRELLAACLAYVAFAFAWAAPVSLSPFDTVSDLGDPLHLAYVMAWDAHQLVRQPWALFDANSFHPYRRSLAFADHLLPEALLTAPFFWLTGNAVLAFNLGVLLGLVLSALAMFLLIRSLTGSSGAAFLSGLIYAFNSYTRHELPRVQVLHVQWWPLALLCLVRFAREGRGRDAAGFAAMLALQSLSGTYSLAYSALLLPFWIPIAYLGARRLPTRAELGRLAVWLALAALPVALVVRPYLVQFRAMGFEKSWAAGADVLSYVLPSRGGVWPKGLAPVPEVPHFLGLLSLTLMALGLARVLTGRWDDARRGLALLALVTGFLGLLLSLGPIVQLAGRQVAAGPYAWLYRYVPLARGMASPERIGVLVILGGAILAGLALAELLSRLSGRARAASVSLLALLLPLEHWQAPQLGVPVPTGPQVPSVYAWLAGESREPVVELPPYPEGSKKLWSMYPYFTTYHWRPVLLGRTSFYPPAHDLLAWSLRGFPDATSLTILQRLGIRSIVVHPLTGTADERRTRLEALESSASLRLVYRAQDTPPARFAPLGLGEERVYRLEESPPSPATAPCVPADEIARDSWALDSSGVNKPERVRDGDRRSAWFTARPQRPGDRFDVRLQAPEPLAAVALEMAYPYDEFPRNLVLFLQDPQGGWHRAPWADGPEERWAVLDELLERPREARLVLRTAPEVVRGIRLMVSGREQDPAWPRWAIPELRLYRSCR